MQTVDMIILSTVILCGVWGLSVGLIRTVVGPLALLLSLAVATSLHPHVVQLFTPIGKGEMEINALALLVSFLIAVLVFGLINRAVTAAIKAGGLTAANHFSGALVGLALGAFLSGGAVYVGWNIAGSEIRTALVNSDLAPLVLQFFHLLSETSRGLLRST